MSIEVKFSNQSKRENSTKQLEMTAATHNCVFKNGCSMLRPTLLLEIDSDTFPTYTAFKIEERYYNITDIRSVRDNLFEVSGDIDVLATYKTNILATTAYVIYDSTTNTELIDNRLPMVTSKAVKSTTVDCPFDPIDGGVFILSLTGSHDTTGIYKVSSNDLADLLSDISDIRDNIFLTENDPPDEDDYGDSVLESMRYLADYWKYLFSQIKTALSHFLGSGNLPENIRECRYIPFNVGIASEEIPIYLGTFLTNIELGKLITDTIHRTVSVSIPWHTSDYRRRPPYTEIYLYLPYIGMTRLSSENLAGQTSLNVSYTLGLRDGNLICTVSTGSDPSEGTQGNIQILGQYSSNVGASVPIGISNINLPKSLASIIQGGAAIASKNLGGVGMAGLNFADSINPTYSSIGGLDGIAAVATRQKITCYTVFHNTNVPPNSEIATIGSPTMAPKSLTNLTGYVQTKSASVAGAMTSDERIKLNDLLDNGIYIE